MHSKKKEAKPKAEGSKQLPAVPESVLKRRKRRETAKAARLQTSIKVCNDPYRYSVELTA